MPVIFVWVFLRWEEAERVLADIAGTDINADHFIAKDDFGTVLSSKDAEFIRMSDMDKALDIQVEQSLVQARAQARAQQRAAQDPTLALLNNVAGASPPGQGFRPRSVPRL